MGVRHVLPHWASSRFLSGRRCALRHKHPPAAGAACRAASYSSSTRLSAAARCDGMEMSIASLPASKLSSIASRAALMTRRSPAARQAGAAWVFSARTAFAKPASRFHVCGRSALRVPRMLCSLFGRHRRDTRTRSAASARCCQWSMAPCSVPSPAASSGCWAGCAGAAFSKGSAPFGLPCCVSRPKCNALCSTHIHSASRRTSAQWELC